MKPLSGGSSNSIAHHAEHSNGFTLIEIVVTLILMSILASVSIQLINTAIRHGTAPLSALQNELALSEVMEKMTADYKWILLTSPEPLETFRLRAVNGNQPAADPYFGEYDIQTKYLIFTQADAHFSEAQEACVMDCETLKITISNRGQRLTALFTR